MSALGAHTCPGSERLSRALSAGAGIDRSLEEHLGICGRCRGEWESLTALVGLTHEIAVPTPGGDRIEAVRSALLSAPRVAPRRVLPRAVVPALALCAAAAVLLIVGRGVLLHEEEGATRRGTVVARGTARFRHEEMHRDEVVRLTEGEIQVEVAPLHKGERFRVRVGDGEIEVRGTAFVVDADHDQLRRVRVLHGLVEVRPADGPPRLLGAGEHWEATKKEPPAPIQPPAPPKPAQQKEPAAPPPAPMDMSPPSRQPTRLPPSTAPRAPAVLHGKASTSHAPDRTAELIPEHRAPIGATTPHASPQENGTNGDPPAARKEDKTKAAPAPQNVAKADTAPVTSHDQAQPKQAVAAPLDRLPSERAFSAGWQALNRRDYRSAAAAFDRAVSLAPADPLAEDARYWLAIAHARAGQKNEAIAALRAFLDHHADSPRSFEVSSILGWQLLSGGAADRASLDEAERRFHAAARSPVHQIRKSAQDGLRALSTRRAPLSTP